LSRSFHLVGALLTRLPADASIIHGAGARNRSARYAFDAWRGRKGRVATHEADAPQGSWPHGLGRETTGASRHFSNAGGASAWLARRKRSTSPVGRRAGRSTPKTNGLRPRPVTNAARQESTKIMAANGPTTSASTLGDDRKVGRNPGRLQSQKNGQQIVHPKARNDQTGKQLYDKALRLARRAEATGQPLPLELLGQAADTGYAPALYGLATLFLFGKAVRKDFSKGAALLKKAAAQHYAPAEYDLAVSYESGKGVKKDPRKAFLYYCRAARNGDRDSQTEVARCYYWGIGTTKNRAKAMEWYGKAAAAGNEEAKRTLATGSAHGDEAAKRTLAALRAARP
jgi:hypothetical protein